MDISIWNYYISKLNYIHILKFYRRGLEPHVNFLIILRKRVRTQNFHVAHICVHRVWIEVNGTMYVKMNGVPLPTPDGKVSVFFYLKSGKDAGLLGVGGVTSGAGNTAKTLGFTVESISDTHHPAHLAGR